jgi:hypothetical protein
MMQALPYRAMIFFALFIVVAFSVTGQQLINQRQITLLEKARRPADPWPRGDGHIVLGEPGSPLAQKGYYEPGGSFSPSPGSFGLSIWVYDTGNRLISTSDDIALDKITQSFFYENNSVIPAIKTITPYYTCNWFWLEPGNWKLSVEATGTNGTRVAVAIRSVGPAGGPLTSATWDSTRLLLNRRWLVIPGRLPLTVVAGNEEAGELLKPITSKSASSESGWCFAKMQMNAGEFHLTIKDTKPQYKGLLSYQKTIPQFNIDVPDKRFENCLQAQVANLMMGYIGRQTGPGEPINYPLAWERDGAYSLMAMAKSGQLQTARELSVYFAENDFFGGFGAEGDAPGSSINALSELAFLLNDPAYYRWVWPHIRRKVAIIDEMLNATGEIYKNFIGPLAPHIESDVKRRQLICRKKEDGLIVGTMDNHFPVLYINAISYRGLVQASRLVILLKDSSYATQCLQKAAEIKNAWTNAFGKKKYENERNFMISIWPSWITDKTNTLFAKQIEEKHQLEWGDEPAPKERPLWTYFTVAEAHQWLFLDRPDRTWKALHFFWNNQCSPGLYSFWEGSGEENTFKQWEHYRGWLQPKYVTPHYWTASEMTLLQMDMLTYIDESKKEYEIVIGAGVPEEWLSEKISVQYYRTKAGTISWEYKNNTLYVTIQNAPKKYTVRAGVNFLNAKTRVNLTYK